MNKILPSIYFQDSAYISMAIKSCICQGLRNTTKDQINYFTLNMQINFIQRMIKSLQITVTC